MEHDTFPDCAQGILTDANPVSYSSYIADIK